MTADIINLRRVRKAKARIAREQVADENRVRFGRTKAERAVDADAADRAARALDGAERINTPANQGSFPSTAAHDDDDGLDPGAVS